MSILIKGMEMPFAGSFKTIVIYPDGTVCTRRQDLLPYKAVSVPPHGRLIDADAVQETVLKLVKDGRVITQNDYKRMDNILFECPTIIEAEDEDNV